MTIDSIKPTDSDRLLKNKITGFIITLQDRLLELKPKLMCNGCGRIANNGSMGSASQTPLSSTRNAVVKNRPEKTESTIDDI